MIEFDHRLFLYLNGFHHPFTDDFWVFMSSNWAWLFFYVPALYFVVKRFRIQAIIPLLFIVALIFLADQGTNLAKQYFERPRPCREEELAGMVHFLANYCGLYGFWSAHAANAFAQISFFMLLNVIPKGKLSVGVYSYLITWAILVAFSRIMVGVHYPFDVLVGAVYGMLCAILLYMIFRRFFKKRISVPIS